MGVDVGPCSFGKARDELVFGLRLIYELRSKLCSWKLAMSKLGGPLSIVKDFLKFSRSEMIKVSDAVPL